MEKLKFALFSIVTLSLLGLFGYWAITTIESGTEHVKDQKIKQLIKENEDLKTEVEKLKDEANVPPPSKPAPDTTKAPETVVYKYQDLINDLQKLVDGNISLKLKSRGPNVGTVQKFLNIYNNTSNKVDNDYGASTVKLVTAFQKDFKLGADGQAGVSTFRKMIDWLKGQK